MGKLPDYYKILQTSLEAIEYKGIYVDKKSEQEIDEFLKKRYYHIIKAINDKIKLYPEKAEELKKKRSIVKIAYEQVATSARRKMYKQQLEREKHPKEREKARESVARPVLKPISYDKDEERRNFERKKVKDNVLGVLDPLNHTAYDVLHIGLKSIGYRTDAENDEYIKAKKNQLLKQYIELIKKSKSFADKQKIQLKIMEINQAYEKIMTAEKRKEYQQQLDLEKNKNNEIKEEASKTEAEEKDR